MSPLPEPGAATLVVPCQLDALAINEPIHSAGQTWNRWTMKYDRLNQYTNPMPAPFTNEDRSPPDIGVHLHWAVPDGLTHGVEDPPGSGQFTYPYLPNRWLVVRMVTAADATPVVSAWVIEADALGTKDGAPFLDPNGPSAAGKAVEPTLLGTSVALEDWPGDSGAGTPFLTALAPGNVTFAGFAPGASNVLAFHDDLDGIDAAVLSYQIMGWYTDHQADPLHDLSVENGGWIVSADAQGQPALVAPTLDWQVTQQDGVDPPSVTAVAGLVHGVTWNRTTNVIDPGGYPTDIASRVRVSVAATGAEALAALIREQAMAGGATAQEAALETGLLEAFQLEVLNEFDTPGGQEELARRLHDSGFARSSGGVVWTIVPATPEGAAQPVNPPPLTPAQLQWLADLNTKQADLDLQRRILDTMQRELNGLWWKNAYIPFDPGPGPNSGDQGVQFENARTHLPEQVDPSNPEGWWAKTVAQQDVVDVAKGKVPIASGPGAADSIKAFADGHLDPSQYILKPEPARNFAAPTDPVMLISGLGRSERFGRDGVLACRAGNTLVRGLSHDGKDATNDSLPAGTLPVLDAATLPPLADPLLAEAFWLTPEDAGVIADKGFGSTDPATVSAISAQIAAQPPEAMIGTPPAANGNMAWVQPWLPLYLEWSVDFTMTYQLDAQGHIVTENGDYVWDRDGWQFDGTDYAWVGGSIAQQQAQTYTGRVMLTPSQSFTFQARLKAYLAKHPQPQLENAEALLEKLEDFDILSQSLSGLTSQLAMIDPNPNVTPPKEAQAVIRSGGDKGVPYLAAVGAQDTRGGQGKPFFFPIRAGYLSFNRLRITDSYGRTLSLLEANGNFGGKADSFVPIKGSGMTPDPAQIGADDAARMLRLKPRLAQPARLDFTWISSEDDSVIVDQAAEASPVCGWLLPNHLDKSLGVYDAAGAYQGEVLPVYIGPGQDTIAWMPAPGGDASPVVAPGTQPDLANAHLQAIVTGLLAHPDGPQALAAFLTAIDETLWTVAPGSGRSQSDLAAIIGRPLAVTRVNLAMDLAGLAQWDQAIYRTFVPNGDTLLKDTGSLLAFDWPVRMGSQNLRSDGTIGYFTGSDYTRFNAVHLPGSVAQGASPYVAEIAEGNYLNLPVRPEDGTKGAAPFDRPGSQYVTLLLDPGGAATAATGLLPSVQANLDTRFVDPALAAMAVTFRAGPLLLDAETVRLPAPSVQSGVWSWLSATGTTSGDWQTDPVSPAKTAPQLSDAPPILREGWLTFVPESDP